MKKIYVVSVFMQGQAVPLNLFYENDKNAHVAAHDVLSGMSGDVQQMCKVSDDKGHVWCGFPRNVSHVVIVDVDADAAHQADMMLHGQVVNADLQRRQAHRAALLGGAAAGAMAS